MINYFKLKIKKHQPSKLGYLFLFLWLMGCQVNHKKTVQEVPQNLPVQSLDGIFIDRRGNIWISGTTGLLQGAIFKLSKKNNLLVFNRSKDKNDPQFNLDEHLGEPRGMTDDSKGNLFVTDIHNQHIWNINPKQQRKNLAGQDNRSKRNPPLHVHVSLDTRLKTPGKDFRIVTDAETFADGPGHNARFDYPTDLSSDRENFIFVADSGNHRIRKISPQGQVSTFAGSRQGFADGHGQKALFHFPEALEHDSKGNLYVLDSGNKALRKITPTGQVFTVLHYPETESQTESMMALAINAHDELYLAGKKGIYRWSQAQGLKLWLKRGAIIGLDFDTYGDLYAVERVYTVERRKSAILKISPSKNIQILYKAPHQ